MASTDARPVPRKNAAYRVYFPIFDADGDLVTGALNLDSEVSVDGATFVDCTNEATEIATSSGLYYLDLTAGEMNGDGVVVQVKTSSTGAKTTVLIFYPEEVGDVRIDTGAVADGIMTRASSNWEASAPVKSLGTAVMKATHRIRDNAGTLEVFRSDGTTVHASQSITTNTDNAPIDELTGAS